MLGAFDQEMYETGFIDATEDLNTQSLAWCEELAADMSGANWYSIGYRTCVQSWKEGVRL